MIFNLGARFCQSNATGSLAEQTPTAAEKPAESGAGSDLDALLVPDSVVVIGATKRSRRNYENRVYQLADKSNNRFLNLVVLRSNLLCCLGSETNLKQEGAKVLLRAAKEPPEHQRIAEYYRQQAERLTNSSKEQQELATIYENKPPSPAMESKHGTSFVQNARLCRRWAQLEAEQAKLAEVLATLHEDVGTTAGQKELR